MNDSFYEKAVTLVNHGNLEEAVSLFEKSLENGNFESALRLGNLYLKRFKGLHLTSPDYKKVEEYFSFGARNNNYACKKELGLLLINRQIEINDYVLALKCVLSLSERIYLNDLHLLENIMKNINKNVDYLNRNCLIKAIDTYNDCLNNVSDNQIKELLVDYRNYLIINAVNFLCNETTSISDFKNNFSRIKKYKSYIFFDSVTYTIGDKEIEVLIKWSFDVKIAEKFLSNMNRSDFKYSSYGLSNLYLYLGKCYLKGCDNANINADLAIKYFEHINNKNLKKVVDDYLTTYCSNLLNEGNLIDAKKYSKYIQKVNSYDIEHKINNYEKEHFPEICNKAKSGDIDAILLVANYYENVNFKKSLLIYEYCYRKYKSKIALTYLCNYYSETNNYSKIHKLIDEKRKNDDINFDLDLMFNPLGIYYANKNYVNVNICELTSIDVYSNKIYYAIDYYKRAWKDNYPQNNYYKFNYYSFMAMKNRTYNINDWLPFPDYLSSFLNLFDGNWIICTVPGHEKTTNEYNGTLDIIKLVSLKPNFIVRNTLIQRKFNVDKKATSYGSRIKDFRRDMESLQIEYGFDVKGKHIIVVDDITTTGSILIACKNILMDAGASSVVLFAFGKTRELPYGY